MATRVPSISTPRTLDLRSIQQAIDNIREGLQAIDAKVGVVTQQAGQTTLVQTRGNAVIARLQQQLDQQRAQLAALLGAEAADAGAGALLSLVMIPGEDGEDGEDGVPGAPAPVEAGAATFVVFPAAVALGGQRAVRLLAGEAIYADNAVVEDANVVLGLTQGAVGAGSLTRIQTGGLMTEPSWAWTADAPVFVGANGVLVQPSPVSGFSLIVGVATSATQIHLGARTPLVLL